MGASNCARLMCCLPKPLDLRRVADGFGKSVASYVRAKSRRTASGRSDSTRSSISSQLARCRLATGVAGRRSQSLADRDHASKQARYPRRGRLHELLRQRSSKHFLSHRLRLKILKSVAPSPTRAIEHFQDDRNRAIRLFSGFSVVSTKVLVRNVMLLIKCPGSACSSTMRLGRPLTCSRANSMKSFQELADEAFADLLKKHGRPTDLRAALRASTDNRLAGGRRGGSDTQRRKKT